MLQGYAGAAALRLPLQHFTLQLKRRKICTGHIPSKKILILKKKLALPFILLYTNQVVSDDIKYVPLVKWPKTPPSHGGNGGSTPPRDTNYLNSVSIRY